MNMLLSVLLIHLAAGNSETAVGKGAGGKVSLDYPKALFLAAHDRAVQKALELDEAHVESVKRLQDRLTTKAITEAEANKRLEALLTSDQGRRLRVLSWRLRGGTALADEHLAAMLNIPPKQRKELSGLLQQADDSLHDALGRVTFKDETARRAFIQKRKREAEQRMLKLLTPEQLRRFRQVVGKKTEHP
jgi:hypothetical protein